MKLVKAFSFLSMIVLLFACQQSKSDSEVIASDYLQSLLVTKDMVALNQMLVEGAVYEQATGLPYGGTYIGFEQWMNMFMGAHQKFEMVMADLPVTYTKPETNIVVCNFSVKFTSRKTGRSLVMPIMEWIEVIDGKIVKIKPYYYDTQAIVELDQ